MTHHPIGSVWRFHRDGSHWRVVGHEGSSSNECVCIKDPDDNWDIGATGFWEMFPNNKLWTLIFSPTKQPVFTDEEYERLLV